ncbi:thiamine pyrophosphokinase 1 isoform X2 [Eurosta solidaginis]|uniref:thiamine pyrophosphokinase 1 isoform X2 n=1 Tax=Eurosta solidaginis TaxID=178769 RepID=UPI003530C39C
MVKRFILNKSNLIYESNSAVNTFRRCFGFLCKQNTKLLLQPVAMQENDKSRSSNCNYCNSNNERVWRPKKLLNPHHTSGSGYACIVLNRAVQVDPQLVKQIWRNAQIHCLVDGGANHWHEFLQKYCTKNELSRPQYITGDFDSITKETREYFNTPDIEYKHTPDQSETDFTKALYFLKPQLERQDICDVIVLLENTGRLDHIMANINTLYKVQSDKLNIYLLSSTCLSWLLLCGKHKILIPNELVECEHWCALIPVGSKANTVTTTGLKWNLSKSALEFGFMVSTSNTYVSEEVSVETDTCLVWSMGL